MLSKFSRRFSFIVIVIALLPVIYFLAVPDVSGLIKKNPAKTAFMEYRLKEWARKGKKFAIYQVWVPLFRVSPYLIKAVIIAEDDKFWAHEGFDYEGIQKAIEKDLQTGRLKFGGSTISQQLAKNLYFSPAKNPLRKIMETIITWKMERVLSKRRILELYLNVAEWGEGIFGVEAAARHYFEKSSSELTPQEAARLAAVLPNPRKYNPVGDQRFVVNRSSLIYNIMVRRGIVTPEYEEFMEGEKTSPAERGETGSPSPAQQSPSPEPNTKPPSPENSSSPIPSEKKK